MPTEPDNAALIEWLDQFSDGVVVLLFVGVLAAFAWLTVIVLRGLFK